MKHFNFLKYSKITLGLLSLIVCGKAYAYDSEDLATQLLEAKKQIELLQTQITRIEAQLEQLPPTADADLEERVEDLELVSVEMDESIGSRAVVSAFDAVSLDIGGFFDSTVTLAIGEEGTDISFNRQVFEFLIRAKLSERWDLFVAQAFIRDANLDLSDPDNRLSPNFGNNNSPITTDTIIGWGQYHHSDLLKIQFGRFITPLGIVNVEHFPASLLDTSQPQFLRPFSEQNLFSNFTNGVNIYGAKYFGNNELSYAAYAGVWAGNSSNATFGGRAGYHHADSGFTIGVNAASGDRSDNLSDDRFYTGGIDILYDKGPLLWKSELFATTEGTGTDRIGFYTQPAIRLSDKFTLFYRYDFFDGGEIIGESTEHVGGIVFDPGNNVRLRALYRMKRLREDLNAPESDLDIIQFSSTFNF